MFQLFFSIEPHGTIITLASCFPRCYSHGRYYACVDHYYACVDIASACAVSATCAGLCGSVHLCAGIPHFSSFFCSACRCCSCCIMSVSHLPSSSQALYFVAATIQQNSRINLFFLSRPRTVHLCMRVRAMFPIGTKTLSQERCKDATQGAERYKHTSPRDFSKTTA